MRWAWYENGIRHGSRKQFDKARDAKAFAAEIGTKAQQGLMTKVPQITLCEYLLDWLDTYNVGVRDNTYSDYQINITKHIIPRIGGVRDIQKAYNNLLRTEYRPGKTYSPKTVINVHSCLRKALKKAVQTRLIAYSPADAVELPRGEMYEGVMPEPEQLTVLLDEINKFPLRYPMLFAVSMGTRRGETLGLHWEDVDFEREQVRIRQVLKINNRTKEVELGPPKTRQGNRLLPLDAALAAMLQTWKREQEQNKANMPEGYEDSGYVFTDNTGRYIYPQRLSDVVSAIGRRANLPGLRLHDLRHICATYMIDTGASPRTVSELLGHTTPVFTMQRYIHTVDASKRAAAHGMAGLLNLGKYG